MDIPGNQVSFTAASSSGELWQECQLRTRIINYLVVILPPLALPAAILWICRYREMGWLNLSVGDCGAAGCALTAALLAKNWGNPLNSHRGLNAALSIVALWIETVVLISSDSGVVISKLLKIATASHDASSIKEIKNLAIDADRYSPGILYTVLIVGCMLAPAIYEGIIIFTSKEDGGA